MNKKGRLISAFLGIFILFSIHSCFVSPELSEEGNDLPDDLSVGILNSKVQQSTFNDFIASVYQAGDADKQALVDSFLQWADSATGIPYIEGNTAYFLYLNGSNPSVSVAGDFNNWSPSASSLTHLTGTTLYYRGQQFEPDARLDYKLVVNNNWILDPLNPNRVSGGYGPNSELSMPAYIQPPEIQVYDIPHGQVTSRSFSDTTQGKTRTVKIYMPPGYQSGLQHYRSIYFHDGSEYLSLGSAKQVLDYLIHEQKIPPVIAVFVDPLNRMEEYAYDMDFMNMFANELVPWIDSEYRTMAEPQSRAVAGVSLGGLTSLLFSLHHPLIFGNCAAFSSAIQIGDLVTQYDNSDLLPTKIYLDAGTYEPTSLNPSSELQKILEADSWTHKWNVWHEGHSWGSWRAHIDEALIYLWPLASTGIDQSYD